MRPVNSRFDGVMPKTVFSKRYRVFLDELRRARKRAGLSQEELAQRTGYTQSVISKCERGERRVDVIELHAFCAAFGVTLTTFTRNLEKRLKA